VGHVEVAWGELSTAVRAGDVGASEAHGVERQSLIIKASGVEAQSCVATENRITAKIFMYGDA